MNETATLSAPSALKADFPGLLTPDGEPWHYLDTAASAQKPQAVIDAMIGNDRVFEAEKNSCT